jgi:DNA-binding PadR family transcriptional regulator
MEKFNQDLPLDKDAHPGLKPLREPTLFILLTLSKRRMHGYAILKDVEALSEGRVVLSTGTLYGALARLLEQGVIRKSSDESGEDSSGSKSLSGRGDVRERKYYELTQFGRRVLEGEINRMATILATASRKLGEEGI